MAVKIRLTRMGKKHKPFYRIVIADSREKRDGKYIDLIGWYNPMEKEEGKTFYVEVEKALDWILKGAEPTETVRSLLRKSGVLKKLHELKYSKKQNA